MITTMLTDKVCICLKNTLLHLLVVSKVRNHVKLIKDASYVACQIQVMTPLPFAM